MVTVKVTATNAKLPQANTVTLVEERTLKSSIIASHESSLLDLFGSFLHQGKNEQEDSEANYLSEKLQREKHSYIFV